MTKAEELIEECIVLEGRYEKKLALMLRAAMKGLTDHSHRDEDGGPLGWEAEALAEMERIAIE